MGNGISAPLVAGLGAGVLMVIVFSMMPPFNKNSVLDKNNPSMSPEMVLLYHSERYNEAFGVYCGNGCDSLLYSRVVPSMPINITKGDKITFGIEGGRKPDGVQFFIQKYSVINGSLELKDTNLQLNRSKDSGYFADLPAGSYIINAIAKWNDKDSYDSHSMHRFKVRII